MSSKEVASAWSINDDGAGIAVLTEKNGEKKWKVIKGITDKEKLLEYINKYKEYHKIVHFRAASAGGVHPELTHPFETPRYILFHNGTWTGWNNFKSFMGIFQHLKKDWREYNKRMRYNPKLMSDTKLLTFLLYLVEEKKAIKQEVIDLIKEAGKIVIIDKKRNRITFYGNFVEDDGRQFSNSMYKGYCNLTYNYGWSYKERWNDKNKEGWKRWEWNNEFSYYDDYEPYYYRENYRREINENHDLSESKVYDYHEKIMNEKNTNSNTLSNLFNKTQQEEKENTENFDDNILNTAQEEKENVKDFETYENKETNETDNF